MTDPTGPGGTGDYRFPAQTPHPDQPFPPSEPPGAMVPIPDRPLTVPSGDYSPDWDTSRHQAPSQVTEGVVVPAYPIPPLPVRRRSRLIPIMAATIVLLVIAVAVLTLMVVQNQNKTSAAGPSTSPTTSVSPSTAASPPGVTESTPTGAAESEAPSGQPPASGPTITGSPTSTATSSSAPPPAAASGSVLGSYSVDLPQEFSVPLSATKPKQADFNTSNQGDLAWYNAFVPLGGDQMVALRPGTKPTYQLCTTATSFEGQAASTSKNSFCLITPNSVIGVYVSSFVSNPSTYAVLNIMVWSS